MNDQLSDYPDALKIKETAVAMNTSEQTIRRWIKDGTLPAFRVRGQYRVPRAALEALIAEAMK